MAAAATTNSVRPPTDAAPATVRTSIDVAELLAAGGTLYGVPVVSLTVRTADGRTQVLELPAHRLVVEPSADGDGQEPETHRDRVLQYLKGLPPGAWAKGRTIAAEIDLEYDGGQFKNLMAETVRDGELESSKSNGYRIADAR